MVGPSHTPHITYTYDGMAPSSSQQLLCAVATRCHPAPTKAWVRYPIDDVKRLMFCEGAVLTQMLKGDKGVEFQLAVSSINPRQV